MHLVPPRLHVVAGLAVLLLAEGLLVPRACRADPLAITRWTVDAGGTGFVQNGSIVMGGTIAQPDAGLLSGRTMAISGGFWIPGAPVPLGVGGGGPDPAPVTYTLAIRPLAPNPMASRTRIAFELPDEREAVVQVFDLGGALRRTVASGRFAPGAYRFDWDGRNADGLPLSSGMYLVRVRLGALVRTEKLVVLR